MSNPPDHRGSGPNPLPLHLGQAAFLVQQAIMSAATDPTAPALEDVAVAAAAQLQLMLDGIAAWRGHPYTRKSSAATVLWSDGSTRLLDFGAQGDPIILILPSLINRADILDLMPGNSFIRALAQAGFRPLLIDWGVPAQQEQHFGLHDYANLRLRPALAIARVLAGGPVPLLGYCMGGAFAAAAAAHMTNDVSHLVTLGTPWDCTAGTWMTQTGQGSLAPHEHGLRAALHTTAQTLGYIPHDVLQTAFASLDPGLALRKFAAFAALPQDSCAARTFVAVEDWLNTPVHLPLKVAETLLIDWHLRNDLANKAWSPFGPALDPTKITCPTLSICATRDRISPPSNAEALPRAIHAAEILRPDTGHVGMIVGRNRHRDVIAPIARFLHARAT